MSEAAYWADPAFKPVSGKTVVFFRAVQHPDKYQSDLQKRPVFREKIHIVKITADVKLRIDRPVRETEKEEFALEWAQWEKTRESRVLGTSVESAPFLSDTQKEEFRAMKIFTVEQLAGLPDITLQKIMGGYDLRKKAQLFIESGKDAEIIGQIRAESQLQIDALKAELAEMRQMMESATRPAGAA